MSKTDIRQLKELASNKELIVCKPDKGRGIVLLDRLTYINKITEIIYDATKFELLSVEIEKYTTKIDDKINNFLRKLKDLSHISSDVYFKLYCKRSAPGILYGLPKIHKPDFSTKFQFRPYLLHIIALPTK